VVSTNKNYDVVLVGGGIMSATLGTLLKELSPKLTIAIFERLDAVAMESSNPWNNAGTGHAALCELNYMPDTKDGSLPDPSKAIQINEQFQLSRQLWSYLVEKTILGDPKTFIHSTPHMTFVRGASDVDYLSRRFEALKNQPLFEGMEFSTDPKQIAKWTPLITTGRSKDDVIAATRIESGTDVDFGSITTQLIEHLKTSGVDVFTSNEVKNLNKTSNGWAVKHAEGISTAKFIFVGAGGYALKLLQKSGIKEAKGYGTFPVAGSFLKTTNPKVVSQHQAKVYSQAAVGAPPMSVPHLDTRVVDGETSLLFGPYAGLNFKFLKFGSIFDLPLSIRFANIIPYLAVAFTNFGLIKYLVKEVTKNKTQKFASLQEFIPNADPNDWELIVAGQRAQVIKKDAKKGGILQFGTEVVSSADGSIAGLLGASPGASTGAHIMLEVLKKGFPTEFKTWEKSLKKMIPSFGTELNKVPSAAKASLVSTAKALKLSK
jgi:malate dehydrogenase (quinone)